MDTWLSQLADDVTMALELLISLKYSSQRCQWLCIGFGDRWFGQGVFWVNGTLINGSLLNGSLVLIPIIASLIQ